MTEQEARTKTISEVWVEFSKQSGAKANCEHIVRIHTGINDQTVRENLEKAVVHWSMLRAVLLERCEKIRIGNWWISFCIAGNQLMVSGNSLTFYADSNTANELLSIYAFWAWELKQRNAESNEKVQS